jgi:hypothetical protein
MTLYTVNATMTVGAWIIIDADSEAEAVAEAHERDARDYEYDVGTAEVEFNVTPEVEVYP